MLREGTGEKKRKRPRAARACELCRTKKYRCDEHFPCSHCKRHKVDCVYDVADHVRQRMRQQDTVDVANDRSRQNRSDAATSPTTVMRSDLPSARSLGISGTGDTDLTGSQSTEVTPGAQTDLPHTTDTQEVIRGEGAFSVIQDAECPNVEVSDVNRHTQNVEFHGSTSSIAFLSALQSHTPRATTGQTPADRNTTSSLQHSLINVFHNEEFSPEALAHVNRDKAHLDTERYYFRQAQVFLEGYFQNLHFIHPILDRQSFMTRCEDLWFGKSEGQPQSFVALYYSIMSLGALIRTWDEEKIDGLGRLDWSRKFFRLTQEAIGGLASMTSLESIQCLFFMAKISQNELNPSLAYLYLGWAVRASCSAGFNRKRLSQEASKERDSTYTSQQIAKLWWGLYSLEIEVSFALGRPDSLGADAYHNQIMLPMEENETSIITVMVHFARIIREVSLAIYLSEEEIQTKTTAASRIEAKMRSWLQQLPAIIRPSIDAESTPRKITKSPTWAKRQKLVLELRFHNVRMVLFRPFLTASARHEQCTSAEVRSATEKCVEAATSTIELMHEIYINHAFFRTWWYNTTYIMYAVSIVLCYGLKVSPTSHKSQYLELGDKTVEILDAMEESAVAKNASATIKQIVAAAHNENHIQTQLPPHSALTEPLTQRQTDPENDRWVPAAVTGSDDSFLSFFDLDDNLDFLGMTFPLNSSHFPFLSDVRDYR